MHMADALLSPTVGATMWAGSLAVLGYASQKLKNILDSKAIPLMGVMGAFIFAAQMINFTIPGTGSSGHLGGGMILAVMLGPHAGFLVMASILAVQALFFADGGLLALGCNIWNLGIYPCFLAFPLIYRPIAGKGTNTMRRSAAAIVSVLIALQLGAFSVVLETVFSGKSELPLVSFALLMQPIHLIIGLVEGIVTAGVVSYVRSARPELLEYGSTSRPLAAGISVKKFLMIFMVLAIITGGVLSWFASKDPDGLEWSIEKITGSGALAEQQKGFTSVLKGIQEKTAVLPDYHFKSTGKTLTEKGTSCPEVYAGASVSGIVGSILVLALVCLIGLGVRLCKRSVK